MCKQTTARHKRRRSRYFHESTEAAANRRKKLKLMVGGRWHAAAAASKRQCAPPSFASTNAERKKTTRAVGGTRARLDEQFARLKARRRRPLLLNDARRHRRRVFAAVLTANKRRSSEPGAPLPYRTLLVGQTCGAAHLRFWRFVVGETRQAPLFEAAAKQKLEASSFVSGGEQRRTAATSTTSLVHVATIEHCRCSLVHLQRRPTTVALARVTAAATAIHVAIGVLLVFAFAAVGPPVAAVAAVAVTKMLLIDAHRFCERSSLNPKNDCNLQLSPALQF